MTIPSYPDVSSQKLSKEKRRKKSILSDEEVVMNEKDFFSFLKALTRVELETWKTELNNSIYF